MCRITCGADTITSERAPCTAHVWQFGVSRLWSRINSRVPENPDVSTQDSVARHMLAWIESQC